MLFCWLLLLLLGLTVSMTVDEKFDWPFIQYIRFNANFTFIPEWVPFKNSRPWNTCYRKALVCVGLFLCSFQLKIQRWYLRFYSAISVQIYKVNSQSIMYTEEYIKKKTSVSSYYIYSAEHDYYMKTFAQIISICFYTEVIRCVRGFETVLFLRSSVIFSQHWMNHILTVTLKHFCISFSQWKNTFPHTS